MVRDRPHGPRPGLAAWGGAKWIGGGDDDLVLYAPYLAIFDVKYALTIAPGSTRASFVYGANDSRLMDTNKNIYQLAGRRDQSYIKLELDISAVDGTPDGKAKLHVYRAGYKDTETRREAAPDVRDPPARDQQRQQERRTRHRVPQHLRADHDHDRRQDDRSPASPAREPAGHARPSAAPAARRTR